MNYKEEIQRQLDLFKFHMNMALKHQGKDSRINTTNIYERCNLVQFSYGMRKAARLDVEVNGIIIHHRVLEDPNINMTDEQVLDQLRKMFLQEIILAGLNAQVEAARSLRNLETHGVQLKLNFDEETN